MKQRMRNNMEKEERKRRDHKSAGKSSAESPNDDVINTVWT